MKNLIFGCLHHEENGVYPVDLLEMVPDIIIADEYCLEEINGQLQPLHYRGKGKEHIDFLFTVLVFAELKYDEKRAVGFVDGHVERLTDQGFNKWLTDYVLRCCIYFAGQTEDNKIPYTFDTSSAVPVASFI